MGIKRSLLVLATIAGLAALAAATAAFSSPAAHPKPPKNTKLKSTATNDLFVLSARSESLRLVSGKNYTMTLNRVSLGVTIFTDRPERYSWTEPTADFAHFWQTKGVNGFKHDPPNGALTILGAKVNADAFVFELTKPRYNAKTHQLTFAAKKVDTLPPGLRHLTGKVDKNVPKRFGEASLFVDSYSDGTGTYCNFDIEDNTGVSDTKDYLSVNQDGLVGDGSAWDSTTNGEPKGQNVDLYTGYNYYRQFNSNRDSSWHGCEAYIALQNGSGTLLVYANYRVMASNQFACLGYGGLNVTCSETDSTTGSTGNDTMTIEADVTIDPSSGINCSASDGYDCTVFNG